MSAPIRLPRGEAGFSLVELILVVTLLSVLSIGFGKFLVQSINGYRWTADQALRSGDARLALVRLMREIGEIPDPVTSVTTMEPWTFEFDGSDGTTRTLSWNGVAGDTLHYTLGDTDYALVAPVDSVGFAYFDESSAATTSQAALRRVCITIIAGDPGHPVRYRTGIHVRNHH